MRKSFPTLRFHPSLSLPHGAGQGRGGAQHLVKKAQADVSQIWSQISEGKGMTVELEMNQVYHT